MAYSDHPLLQKAYKYADRVPADGVEGYQDIAQRLAFYSPQDRAVIIEEIDNALGANNGATLRHRAQLLALQRHLTDADKKLRRANR